jgi:hypothetical protein
MPAKAVTDPPSSIDFTHISDVTTIQPTGLPTRQCSWLVSIRSRCKVQSTALAAVSGEAAGGRRCPRPLGARGSDGIRLEMLPCFPTPGAPAVAPRGLSHPGVITVNRRLLLSDKYRSDH